MRLVAIIAALALSATAARAHLPGTSANPAEDIAASGDWTHTGDVTHDANTVTVEADATLVTACGTDDCGAIIDENTSNPTAPASGKQLLHAMDDGKLYRLPNGGTSTPGDQVCTSNEIASCTASGTHYVTMQFQGANECQGGQKYMGPMDIGCDAAVGQVSAIPFSEAWTVTEMCCTVAEAGATDCDISFTLFDNDSADATFTVAITDAGSACDTSGTGAFGTADEIAIGVLEDGGTTCGSNTRVGCTISGTIP